MKKSTLLTASIVVLALMGAACLFSPKTGDGDVSSGFYTPADSAWKVIHNFQLAYETKNFDAYQQCLHEEFEFVLLEVDWDDYDGDGIIDQSWGRDIEEMYTENMFESDSAEYIELTLEGTSETPWFGDSLGQTIQMVRAFDLKVYFMQGGQQHGYHAVGDAIFLVKPNDQGEYQIWRWTDQSEV